MEISPLTKTIHNSNIDSRGILTSILSSEIPFQQKRLFWITAVPKNSTRGNHGHFISNQYLVCISGHIQVSLRYKKLDMKVIELDANSAIWVPPLTWISMKFMSSSSTLLVMADTEYDPSDVYSSPDDIDFDK